MSKDKLYELFWSSDLNYEEANKYFKGYSNRYKDFTYRIKEVDYPLYGLKENDFVSTKFNNILTPGVSEVKKFKQIVIPKFKVTYFI